MSICISRMAATMASVALSRLSRKVSKAAIRRRRSGLASSSPRETPTMSKRLRSCSSISPVISAAVGCRRKSALT